jgi:hypothetical protein
MCNYWYISRQRQINTLSRQCINTERERKRKTPCGGGIEYLHRDHARRTSRRKGKSRIWESNIWSRVPRDSDPRNTALAKASSINKRQPRPLVREGASQKQDRNCQRVINIWSWAPDGARHQDLLVDWPSIAMWLWLAVVKVNCLHQGIYKQGCHKVPSCPLHCTVYL